ncbi:MAG: hypothetical protein JXA73_05930 [Acidobacteria bacterium]|nr:hypothetical protein [Acidobacteriota bacterium]
MPDRYHINTVPTPGRFRRVGKFGGMDWREDCSRCTNCVKPRCCFDVYKNESVHNRDPITAIQPLYECKACFSCVQGCTKGLLSLSINPEFLDMGDEYWKPDIILNTWNQADTGKIPVSGAGYRGPFHGPGFDSIWTDMSEIVRPTRDGIHGREYISTSVDIGSKPMRLSFAPDGKLLTVPSQLMELQIPAVLDIPAWTVRQFELAQARAMAAKELQSVAMMFAREAAKLPPGLLPWAAPIFGSEDVRSGQGLLDTIGETAQLLDCPDVLESAALIREVKPQAVLSVRLRLMPDTVDRILQLSGRGIKVFHLCADQHGCEHTKTGIPGRHIKDVLREIHGRLVNEGFRDEVTLIISGGIAMAEHMAKAIICGADLVAVDTALLVALGCRVCRKANSAYADCAAAQTPISLECPLRIGSVDSDYAAHRMTNLMGAWQNQLIEVLGAMGIREVRRLRGEMGRAIFMEEIEKEAFGDLLRISEKQAGA